MTWSVDSAVQVQNLMASIKARLEAGGWTLTDRDADGVWHATNNQGVTQYIQITNCQNNGTAGSGAAWQYLQFQGWLSWNTGTHAGVSGSGTTVHRLYYASANVAAATPVDLFMSVTANRLIIFIMGAGNYRNWAYFGGLDALAGTSDPYCVLLLASFEPGTTPDMGAILAPAGSPTSYWTTVRCATIYFYGTNNASGNNGAGFTAQLFGPDVTKAMIFPILVVDTAPLQMRGNLDGLLFCPVGSGVFGNLDSVTVGSTTYLIAIPGGAPNDDRCPIFGKYQQGLAIAEV